MKKKGFTLIELLAVIVILGIIILIATPLILNVINDARKSSFKNSAYGIIKAAENEKMLLMMDKISVDEISFSYTEGEETSSEAGRKLDYRGTKPESGMVVINKEGQVGIAIHNGKWCVEKGFDDSVVELTNKSKDDCKLQVAPPKEEIYEDKTGASIPKIDEGMIPIMWDGSKWVKADINKKWYDYNNKEWANAALVTESSRNSYKAAAFGEEIKEADVLAYLVWIPRYKYKLFNVESAVVPEQEIEIVFESKTNSKSNGSTNGAYLTHPAFTFGNDELDGFWVGKFELTGDATTPTVKPNVASLRSQNVSTQFATHQKFNNLITYGLTNDADAHMLKNMEWGAITYLSHSKYGKNEEIWINPSSDYITGCAGSSVSSAATAGCPNTYHSINGVQASTTGNVTGVYDMSGSAFEYVMGGMYNVGNSTMMLTSSGFTQATIDSPDIVKYLDKYEYGTTYNDQAAYNRRHLGDATGETCGWYGDYQIFVNLSYSWFTRGGNSAGGVLTGSFNFYRNTGISIGYSSSRLAVSGLR